jgi:hypothetical protein
MPGDMPFFLVDRCKKTESSIREVTSADEPFEKAAAPSTNSAAAQLDHFSLREKLGLEQYPKSGVGPARRKPRVC